MWRFSVSVFHHCMISGIYLPLNHMQVPWVSVVVMAKFIRQPYLSTSTTPPLW
ncbi:hypothetical protein BC943DRAFT_328431 [Umbelopsis sp. AD052]|nr:hypothetical protein BC943DRAFT_328431 [Umbelopsis sp. AD052]